jgi:anti-anti-sigma factor
MDIEVSQEQGRRPVTVFHIKGEINITTYEQLEQKAREAFNTGTRDLLLDLTEVTYISSAGIRALNNVFKLLRSDAPEESDEAMRKGLSDGTFKSPHLKLQGPSPRVLEVLKIAGVDMLLQIHQNRKDALASF